MYGVFVMCVWGGGGSGITYVKSVQIGTGTGTKQIEQIGSSTSVERMDWNQYRHGKVHIGTSTGEERTDWKQYLHGRNRLEAVPAWEKQTGSSTCMGGTEWKQYLHGRNRMEAVPS